MVMFRVKVWGLSNAGTGRRVLYRDANRSQAIEVPPNFTNSLSVRSPCPRSMV